MTGCSRTRPAALALCVCSGLATTVYAQPARTIPLGIDSGAIRARAPGAAWTQTVMAPGASWIRLAFGDVTLPGNPETDSASYLLVTSLADGAVQRLDARTIRQWGLTSAVFNGDAVRVDLVTPAPASGAARVVLRHALAGTPPNGGLDSQCGPTDDRVLSSDGRIARVFNPGGSVCTAFVISDGPRCMLSAGSCAIGPGTIIEFNVPLSSSGGVIAHPSPKDQYAVDPASIQSQSAGPGADWAYFGVFPNSSTGMGAATAQAGGVNLSSAPSASGQTLRVTGYGAAAAPLPLPWSRAQKTGLGAYFSLVGALLRHQIDSSSGDAGAPVRLDASGHAIAIHNSDGCTDPVAGTSNTATAVQNAALQAAMSAPSGVCAGAGGPPEPPLYLGVDAQGRLATVSRLNGAFGSAGSTGIPGPVDGLAFDRSRRLFYASERIIGGPDRLYTIDPVGGAATLVGTITGPPDISGLAFDPDTSTLYGIDQGSGRLYTINPATAGATPRGATLNPNVAGIDFDAAGRVLYGLEDHPTLGTRLIRIDTTTGAPTVIGVLGPGITDCDGLAYCTDDGFLYTIDEASGRACRVNPATGVASPLGPAGAFAGSGYGLACATDCTPPCVANTPSPGIGEVEIPITGNLAWLGCPNQKVFGVDSNPNLGINTLYDIVCATGGATAVGPTTPGSNQITGLAWAGSSLYALDLTTGGLLTIDSTTGRPTLAAATGITGWQGLAADPTDLWTLYGITQTNRLYRIAWNGQPTLVTNSAVGSLITALEFDRLGQLWGVEFASGRILRINKQTGAVTLAATTIPGFQGLDFDDAGTPYVHNSSTDSLYTLNTQSGVATLRGSSGTSSVTCLAFGRTSLLGPPPPPPGGPGRLLFDPTNLTRSVMLPPLDPALVIDHDRHGLPAGMTAFQGGVYPTPTVPPAALAPPNPPGRGGGDAACGGSVINFDDAPAPCGFPLATRLTYQYADRGVVFEGPGGSDGGAVLNTCAGFGVTGLSTPNFLAFNPSMGLADGGTARGPETIRFTSPVSSVQILVGSSTPGQVTLQAFRAGALVSSASVPLTTTMTPVSVLGSGITRVVISATGPFVLDDLCFVQSCPTTYDVYFGPTNPPPLRAAGIVSTTFDPGELASTTLYYWRIVAHNCCGQTEGPLWRFTTVCYPNCDHSTTPPILNVNDFVCFSQRFAAGDPYANCDDNTIPPLLTVNDFVCFTNQFAAGCPQ